MRGLRISLEPEADEATKDLVRDPLDERNMFQAPDFYKRFGYQVYGELHEHPPGHTLYYLSKYL